MTGKPIKRATRKRQLAFMHSEEMRSFLQKKAFDENLDFSELCRQVFNAGFTETYNIEIRGNIPILPDHRAA